jgi:formylglycine-generating enzyme required for sulfatase activity
VARAGTSTVCPWGDSLSSDQANFDGNSPYGGAAQGKDLERTTTVASYAPNPWGLYDTAGNVWEWVWDWYDSGYYGQLGSTTAVDPAGPSQRASLRVLRGGGWGNVGRDCRPAFRRFRDVPGYRNRYFGFRLALGRS